MLFLWGSVLYRAGTGWHESAKTKRRFVARVQTLNAHCSVWLASFAARKNKPTVCHAECPWPQYQAERARCAGYGLVAKFARNSLISLK